MTKSILLLNILIKDALTWWYQFKIYYTNTITTTDWDSFKAEVKYAFEDIDKIS